MVVNGGQDDHTTAGLVRSVGELLDDPNVQPALKAALFQVASGLQGMTVREGQTDPTGRPATLLTIGTESVIHEWWFDPASEQLLSVIIWPGSGCGAARRPRNTLERPPVRAGMSREARE